MEKEKIKEDLIKAFKISIQNATKLEKFEDKTDKYFEKKPFTVYYKSLFRHTCIIQFEYLKFSISENEYNDLYIIFKNKMIELEQIKFEKSYKKILKILED